MQNILDDIEASPGAFWFACAAFGACLAVLFVAVT